MTNYKKYPTITGFSTTAKGTPREIFTKIEIIPPSYLGLSNISTSTLAIWDTGATGSVISGTLASKMNLIPTGKARVSGVNGTAIVDTYELDIKILHNVGIRNLTVTEGNLGKNGEIGFLIGMDIINLGDFCFTTTPEGKMFSFRIPGVPEPIDFKADIDEYLIRQKHKAQAKKHLKKRRKR